LNENQCHHQRRVSRVHAFEQLIKRQHQEDEEDLRCQTTYQCRTDKAAEKTLSWRL
jgi:hypothetical protein